MKGQITVHASVTYQLKRKSKTITDVSYANPLTLWKNSNGVTHYMWVKLNSLNRPMSKIKTNTIAFIPKF